MVGIPRPPGFFRATGTVDSTAIQDGQVGKVDISTTLIHDHTAKTEPVVTDALLLADSQASNVNKKATITNIAKATGERFAGTNATSALSEADGVGRVNIGSTTASTAPAPADKLLIEVGGVNKSTTITNLTKAVGEVAAGTQASSALTEVDGVMAVDPTDVAVAVGADSVLIRDATDGFVHEDAIADLMTAVAGTQATSALTATSGVLAVAPTEVAIDVAADSVVIKDADDSAIHTEAVADLATAMAGAGLLATAGVLSAGTLALATDDDKSSIFIETGTFDFGGSADAVDTKIIDSMAAKGQLLFAIYSVNEVADGTTSAVISLSSAASAATKMADDVTITLADTVYENNKNNALIAWPVVGANSIVASEGDVYLYAAASAGRTAGQINYILVFMKTA